MTTNLVATEPVNAKVLAVLTERDTTTVVLQVELGVVTMVTMVNINAAVVVHGYVLAVPGAKLYLVITQVLDLEKSTLTRVELDVELTFVSS